VPRSNANLVLLPDGSLVTVGGAAGISGAAGQNFVGDPPDDRLRQVELYRPGDTAWELGPPQQKFRSYHSTALLLPDGRVLSAGDDYWSPVNDPDPRLGEDIAEIYSPPYLYAGARPRIATAPATLAWGQAFRVAVSGRQAVRAVLMAPGAVTHGNDMNQRHVELAVARAGTTGMDLKAPPSPAVAPPGWYMLFVLAADGTPSVARWVQMKAAPSSPPARTPAPTTTGAPPADVTPPVVRARLAAPRRLGRPARLRVRLSEAGTVRVVASARRKRTRRTRELAAGRTARFRIALPARRRVRVTIRLRAADHMGNRSYRRLRRTLNVPRHR
jgi:hypothetical protein